MSDETMDRNYRGPQIIGNWRRRQARQDKWNERVRKLNEWINSPETAERARLGTLWDTSRITWIPGRMPPRRRRAGTFGGRLDSR